MFVKTLFIGTALIGFGVLVHAMALFGVMVALEKMSPKIYKLTKKLWQPLMLVIAVMSVFVALTFQIWVWALFYLKVGALGDLETALYFSTSVFTTVGFGDVVLDGNWRLLSSFQSAHGFILFGWSTAFIFEVTSKLYRGETIRKTESK